jgi:small subunit ribosomal protein S16
MVKIRLQRVGAKNRPSYRLVVADSRAPRDGAFINIIGHYNPLTDPETIVIDEEKARHWLKQGAQPTDTAARLLVKLGVINKPKTAEKKTVTTKDKLKTPEEDSKTTKEKPKVAKKKVKAPKEKS